MSSLSIGAKIYCVVGMCLLCMGVISGFAIYQLQQIGSEIEAIAEQDIPLTEILTKITTHQLEQSIEFERAARYGESMASDSHAKELYVKAKDKFHALALKVDKEIIEGEELAQEAVAHAHTPEEQAEFQHVLDVLKKIEIEHAEFDEHVEETFHLLEAGKIADATKLEEKIEHEVEELNHELEALLFELEAFTANATLKAEAHEKFALKVLIILTIAMLIVATALSVILVRSSLITPVKEIIASLEKLLHGDFTTDIAVRSNDEIGKISQALRVFRDKLVENEKLQSDVSEAQRKADDKAKQSRLELADSLENTVGTVIHTLSSAATEMNSSAKALTETAQVTDSRAMNVAAASDQASQNVQAVASATEELSCSVREITRQVQESSTITNQAVVEGDNANQTVQSMAEMAEKIGSVVSLINDIAEQTNLLALNATIEAARAGEAGKGFAVVASEVKNLANQTANATQEISDQVNEMQTVAGNTAKAIGSITETINKVNEITKEIANVAEEQEAATQEISRNVQQASQGTQEVSSSINDVKNGASETGHNAQEVLAATSELASQSTILQDEIDKFLVNIRSA